MIDKIGEDKKNELLEALNTGENEVVIGRMLGIGL